MRNFALAACVALVAACRALDPAVAPISTDRPGLLFASTTVPRGALQLEVGAPALQLDRGRGSELRVTQLATQLRYGWNDKLELRLASALAGDYRAESNAGVERDRGPSDVELGAKYALAEQTALIAAVRAPTGVGALGSDDPAFSLIAIHETPLGSERSFKGLLGWTGGELGDEWVDSLSLGILLSQTVTRRFSGYVSLTASPVLGEDTAPAYAGVGLVYLLSSDAQIDCSADFGMGDDALDALLTAGLSLRW